MSEIPDVLTDLIGGMGGSIHNFERGGDPWHRDAFPDELKPQIPGTGKRKSGWFGLDAWGNPIVFVSDEQVSVMRLKKHVKTCAFIARIKEVLGDDNLLPEPPG